MRCIIIEDQPPAQRILKKYIKDYGSLQLIGVFSEPMKAIEFLKESPVDLIFLDIHLPKISGIELLKIIPEMPPVILTTAFSEYALESYDLNVIDYLLKPFSFQRFTQAVSKVPLHKKSPNKDESAGSVNEVFIKSGHEYVKINISDIRYIKSDADYTEIFVENKKHLSAEPLRFWVEYFDPAQFVRIHKSYVVNTSKISKISGNTVYLSNGERLPVGRAYKLDFTERFLK